MDRDQLERELRDAENALRAARASIDDEFERTRFGDRQRADELTRIAMLARRRVENLRNELDRPFTNGVK